MYHGQAIERISFPELGSSVCQANSYLYWLICSTDPAVITGNKLISGTDRDNTNVLMFDEEMDYEWRCDSACHGDQAIDDGIDFAMELMSGIVNTRDAHN